MENGLCDAWLCIVSYASESQVFTDAMEDRCSSWKCSEKLLFLPDVVKLTGMCVTVRMKNPKYTAEAT